jgi:predicted dehydrogenase
MSKLVKIGVIGCGGMGRGHARNILNNPNFELVGVADASEASLKAAKDQLGVANLFLDFKELLKLDGLEAVAIVTPTFVHKAATIAAAEAQKHIFCEKPFSLAFQDMLEAKKAIEKAGMVFAFGLVLRHMNVYKKAKELIESGQLGTPLSAHCRYSGFFGADHYVYKKASGRGPINEYTIHMLDATTYMLGEVESLAAYTTRCQGRETEDNIGILIKFKSDAICNLSSSGTTRFPTYAEITGSQGEIAVYGNSRLERITAESRAPIPVDNNNAYYDELEDFRLAIVEGRKPLVNLEVALYCMKLVEAVYTAAETRKTVKMANSQ